MPIGLLSKGMAKSELSHSQDHDQPIPTERPSEPSEQKDTVDVDSLVSKKPQALPKLSGFDFASIEKGVVRISAPLSSGKFDIPGPFADAIVKVRQGASVELSVGIGKENGISVVEAANIVFQPPIKIKNPASALQPTKPGLTTRILDIDFIKDQFADIVISKISISKTGQIFLDGYLKVGMIGRKDLCDLIPPQKLPRVDLRLDGLGKRNQTNEPSTFNFEKLLQGVGAVLGEATFSVEAHTEPRQMELKAIGLQAWTDKSKAHVELHGRARLTRQNSLHFNLDANTSRVGFDEGIASIGGEVRVSDVSKKAPSVESHIAFSVDAQAIRAQMQLLDEPIDIEFPAGQNRVSGHAFVFRDSEGKVTLKDASCVAAHVSGNVRGDLNLKVGSLKAKLRDARFDGDLRANLALDPHGPHISSAQGRAHVSARDLTTNLGGIAISAAGDYSATISARDIRYSKANTAPSAMGQAEFVMAPSKESMASLPGLHPLESRLNFHLKDDATLKIDHVRKGITEFLSPFSDALLKANSQTYSPGFNCAPIGSAEFRRRCESIGNAKVRKNNEVELLINGVTSLPRRLQIIEGAQKSICMQTMVFKDDESGRKIADALCAAAKRGVDVRVIVDALGNATSLMEVIGMNPIYARLRKGGVKLEIHNNSIGEGVQKVLQAISTSRRISEVFHFEDFSNPSKLFSMVKSLAQIALGEIELDLDEAQKRELICGLTQILSGGRSEYDPKLVQRLAEITKDDVLELAEFLEILRQNAHLNFRWHEKYLIADQNTAIVGGMNTADEYLLGGTGKIVTVRGKEGVAWRDTDVCLKGEAAGDAFQHFADNWRHLTKETLPAESISTSAAKGDYHVQMVHSRPRIDNDSHILDLMIECLGSLQPGETAFAENGYFLPTGKAKEYEDALVNAAKRGVNVCLLINSETTMDVTPVVQGSVFSVRRLLSEGVRVFERSGNQMLHSKVAVFGRKVAVVGSWNADNRSSSLNSESAAVVHSYRFAKKIEAMISDDMKDGSAREIHLEDIDYLPAKTEVRNAMSALLSDFL